MHIVADAGLFPPFDRTRSDFQQLRAPADASLKWEVAIRFGKDKYWDWLILRGAAGSVVAKLPRTQADLQSLAQITDTQPAFVHFFLPPARQQQELEEFVDRIAKTASPNDAHVANLEAPWRKKNLPKTEETLRPSPPERIKKPKRSEEPDDATITHMSEDQRFDLARQKIWEGTKTKLRHMWQHPGETLKGFGASLLLLDTPEVFGAIGENLTEFLDSDANPWARAAAGTEAAGKLSGWLAALAGAFSIIVGIIAFATGIGEVAAGILAVGALVAGAVSLALHGGASVLRAKAASKDKTAAEFNRDVEAGAGDLANGIAGMAVIIAGSILHAGKAVLPENVRDFFHNLGKRIRATGSTALEQKWQKYQDLLQQAPVIAKRLKEQRGIPDYMLGSMKTPVPSLKSSAFGWKIADEVPEGVPRNWSSEQIADSIVDYETSIASRKAELAAFDAAGGGSATQRLAHARRIAEEESFLRSLEKALSSSSRER